MTKTYPGGRYWKYTEAGIECLGCGNHYESSTPCNPFDAFDRLEHSIDCPVKGVRGGMMERNKD